MAEQKVKLTDLPAATDTIDAAQILINQNSTDQKLPVTHFLRAKNNLSDLDNSDQARANLNVPSVDEVNNKLAGYIDGGYTFLAGGSLASRNDFIWDEESKSWYYWTGTLPKDVPPASNPKSTGGVVQGAWASAGDDVLRNEVFALNGGVARSFQTVADMKAFEVENGHLYQTAGYYAFGDVGGATYVASTTGSTPDGYGDHVASNGAFLRLISPPTDANHGAIADPVFSANNAWHNRNALQTLMRNGRGGTVTIGIQGVYCVLGSLNVGRDNLTVHLLNGCYIQGYYDDPSIPDSTKS